MAEGTTKVWLTGAEGLLGSVLGARLQELGTPFVATDRELDIADLGAVARFVEAARPHLILNAAAYTRVDDAETHEDQAFRANALGPENLGIVAARSGAAVLHVSTDYVFDGRASEPYREDAACAPGGAYGRSKYEGERRLLEVTGGRSVWMVRTSWLFGERGPSFVRRIVELLAERDELRIVADQRGRPTYTKDLAEAALRLTGLVEPERHPASARPHGIYHFANSGETTWHGLAEAIFERARRVGFPVRTTRILPITTAEYPLPAARPAYSVLDTRKIEAALGFTPRTWQATLDEFLAKLRPSG
jgi:dTDP-4-dehydrorhamnose reductase